MVPVPRVFVRISGLLLDKACETPAEPQGWVAAAVTGLGGLQLALGGKWAPSPIWIKGGSPVLWGDGAAGLPAPSLGAAGVSVTSVRSRAGAGACFHGVSITVTWWLSGHGAGCVTLG